MRQLTLNELSNASGLIITLKLALIQASIRVYKKGEYLNAEMNN